MHVCLPTPLDMCLMYDCSMLRVFVSSFSSFTLRQGYSPEFGNSHCDHPICLLISCHHMAAGQSKSVGVKKTNKKRSSTLDNN